MARFWLLSVVQCARKPCPRTIIKDSCTQKNPLSFRFQFYNREMSMSQAWTYFKEDNKVSLTRPVNSLIHGYVTLFTNIYVDYHFYSMSFLFPFRRAHLGAAPFAGSQNIKKKCQARMYISKP